ncbi:LysR family transcriptional regulator [Solihabitans fulvus]|uniref:LysR family transcriptional regulator n=1 Tax=Solihabitans fulvus TaxID=1892852 RepID=A0A5B2XHX7_9PSEU|nr:LysR family transcriptional regulator [Solihabitans fulvus]KAA2263013.1 LysR family transcriptional regulator [Solihabitans fulvus]
MPELELRHLRAVCAIAEEGSVTKAAARLGLTQPALSAQLRSVERLLGGQLFERTPTGSVPTELGRYVISTARVVLDDLGQLLTSARERAAGPASGPLLAGSMPMLFVAHLVAELRARIRCTEVRTEIEPSPPALLEMLMAGRVHLAVFERFDGMRQRELRGIELRTLLTEPQFVAVGERNPLAARESIDLGDLADSDWVMPPPEQNTMRMQLHAACHAVGFTPRITHHTTESSTARGLVSDGAVSLAAPSSRSGDGIAIRPLRGDPLSVQILVATRSDGMLAGRAHEVFACAAHAYRAVVDRNPTYARWWIDHPEAHPDLDTALLLARPAQPR